MKKNIYLVSILVALTISQSAMAWQPTRPIEAVVGFTPGSGNETILRAILIQVEKNTGARFVVVNKPGAGTVVATEYISKRPNNGYHVQSATISALAGADRVQVADPGFTLDDFTYIGFLGTNPMAIIARADDPVKNFDGFLKAMRTESVPFGDPGAAARMAFEILVAAAKIPVGPDAVRRIEYRGPTNAMNDVIGGHVRFALVPSSVALPQHRAGTIRIIALSSRERNQALPNVETIPSKLPGFEFELATGLIAPKGLPPDVLAWYVREFKKAAESTEVRTLLAETLSSTRPDLVDPQRFESYVRNSYRIWTPVIEKLLQDQKKK